MRFGIFKGVSFMGERILFIFEAGYKTKHSKLKFFKCYYLIAVR